MHLGAFIAGARPVGRLGQVDHVALVELQPGEHFLGQHEAGGVADRGQAELGHGGGMFVPVYERVAS